MKRLTLRLLLLSGLLASLAIAPAGAQEDQLPEDAQSVGMIKGTSMLKNEFRALAYTQMLAVSLNAHTYYLENNKLPADYYELYNSGAWNIDITNIFTGKPVDAVYYDPESIGKTNLPPVGLMTEMRPLDTTPRLELPSGPADPDNPIITPLVVNGGPLRVDASSISTANPGDILYYTDGTLLQLVIWAPDGTYVEYVDNSPNRNWLSIVSLDSGDYSWPVDVYSAEVLMFCEELLPQYYGLYSYMSNKGDIPRHQFASWTAQQRIELAAEMHITIWNPYTKTPIKATESPSRGDFLMEPGSPPSPLIIALEAPGLLTLQNARDSVGNAPGTNHPIFGEPGESEQKPAREKRKSKRKTFGSR